MQKLLCSTLTFICVCFSTSLFAYPDNLPECLRDDYDQLEMLYKETAGDGWLNSEAWLKEPDMSKWFGVKLTEDGCDVAEINLSGNHLTGVLPPSLKLSVLTRLDLSNNELGGDIPLWDLKSLNYLNLSINKLEKNIPDFDLPRLTYLGLHSNLLSSTIPGFNGLGELRHLDLSENQLGGRIPDFTSLSNLLVFDVYKNKLEGDIPVLKMPLLETFNISSNGLNGRIPDMDLPNLLVFDIHSNLFTGEIPTNLNSKVLTSINMSSNSFEGKIPAYNSDFLEILNLSSNKITGGIPDMSLPNLKELNLSFNGLEGEIGNVNFPKLVKLYLNNNGFKGKIPEFESVDLTEVVVNDNYFSGSLPTFERSHLSLLHISNNRFVFGDLEGKPWLSMSSPQLEYNAQEIIPLSYSGQYLSVQTGAPDAEQSFGWYKNGSLIVTTNTHLYQPTSSGIYTCQISHKDITVPSDEMRNLVLKTNSYTYNAVVLSTELTSLAARPLSNSVQIDWQTASEKNNDYFDIERSLDGKNFQKVGTQKAQGDNKSTMNYTFIDEKAVTGTQYYRLKMVDLDKTARYSNTVAATLTGANAKHPLSISPNPATENVHFQIALDASSTATLDVRDLLGRSIYHTQLSGSESIDWQRGNTIDGIYFITLTTDNQEFTKKLILK